MLEEQSTKPAQPAEVVGDVKQTNMPMSEEAKWALSITDDEFPLITWDKARDNIETQQLSRFTRKPSDLRRYFQWAEDTRASWGSVAKWIASEMLPGAWGAPPYTPRNATPFADAADYCVLANQWPYGFESGISQFVVWMRTPLPVDEGSGLPTPEGTRLIADFVQRTFVDDPAMQGTGAERVLWFRNPSHLQSVRALEHIHVLVRGVDRETVERWTQEQPYHKA